MSLSDERIQRFLGTRAVVVLATLQADGSPLAMPMWFLHDAIEIAMISVDGTQKVRNLRRDPRVCVVAEANGLVSKAALGTQLCERIREAADGQTRLPMVPPSLADSMRRRLDSEEQAIFGMMLADMSSVEIGRTLSLGRGELEARQWAMLRKLERLDPPH